MKAEKLSSSVERRAPATRPVRAGRPCRATVAEIRDNGEILVAFAGVAPRRSVCDVLETGSSLELKPGDRVLAIPADDPGERGCVLGRLAAYRKPDRRRIELEAGEELVLKCGQGSITVRSDGRILIQGLDIVSRARRTNRIRGGSIQLN